MAHDDAGCSRSLARVLAALATRDREGIAEAVEDCRRRLRDGRVALTSLGSALAEARARLDRAQEGPTPANVRELEAAVAECTVWLGAARGEAEPVALRELPGVPEMLGRRDWLAEARTALPDRLTLAGVLAALACLALPWIV